MNIEKMVNEVFDETNHIIKQFGPRLAGTKASKKTAEYLYEKAKKTSDFATIEEFNVYKGAFFGWIKILVFNYLVAVILAFMNLYLYAAILSLVSVIILIVQFFFYLPLIDIFYPKKKGYNVYGTIEPKSVVKRQIIISGHHDSAPIFNFFIHQPKLYNLRTTGSIGLVILMFISSVIAFFFKNPTLNLIFAILFAIGSLLVVQMWFFVSKKATPGAGDNLIATTLAFSVGKYFYDKKQNGEGLENTRIIFASFDAEEEGLRGARAFVKKNIDTLKDIKTYLLNADCLYDEKELFFLTSDLNDTVKLDEALINDLLHISKGLNLRVKTQKQAFLTGGTDAAEFGKKKISATTLIGMPWTNSNRSPLYHTPNDITANVSRKVVHDAINIFVSYIENKD